MWGVFRLTQIKYFFAPGGSDSFCFISLEGCGSPRDTSVISIRDEIIFYVTLITMLGCNTWQNIAVCHTQLQAFIYLECAQNYASNDYETH